MCTLKFMSEMTGLSQEAILKKKSKDEYAILKSLCMRCKRRNKKETYAKIAQDFNLSSHATVVSNIRMIENNSKNAKVIIAKQTHKCYMHEQEKVCIIPATISEAKEIIQETLEDILLRTSAFDKRFEEILSKIHNRDCRNSPQRMSCRL